MVLHKVSLNLPLFLSATATFVFRITWCASFYLCSIKIHNFSPLAFKCSSYVFYICIGSVAGKFGNYLTYRTPACSIIGTVASRSHFLSARNMVDAIDHVVLVSNLSFVLDVYCLLLQFCQFISYCCLELLSAYLHIYLSDLC